MEYKLSPSILSADFCNLEEGIRQTEENGAVYLHFDVMDGVFVPSISFGMPVLASIKPAVKQVIDTHLMITEPIRYVEAFQKGKEDREAQKPVKTFEQKLLELLKILFIKDFSMEKKKERLEKEYVIMMKRETESEVMEMCNFSDFIEERGIKKGLEQGKVNTTVQHVQNLMQFSNLSANEAMKMLGVEKELQSVILNKLQQA